MDEPDNKSILSNVLFLDIVEYSRKSVSEQIALKECFNAFLSAAIQNVPVDDRIILDTGDGAAINFLGNAGDVLKVALAMRENLLNTGAGMDPPLLVRMGISNGPVRLVKDSNGLPNIVGDGINVAQRVMGFAAPGQILVSQSFFDAVSRLSQEYAGMFHYQGSRTDKHVREHEIYAIGYPGEFIITQKNKAVGGGGGGGFSFAGMVSRLINLGRDADGWVVSLIHTYNSFSTAGRTAIKLSALVITLILLFVVIGKIMFRPAVPELDAAGISSQHAVHAQSAVAVTPPAVAPVEQLKSKQKKPHIKNSRVRTLEETTAINAGEPALVSLAVSPWGEIYLDGRMQGVSPPLAELQVVPGEHEIEIRNTTFPVFSQKFRVQPNGKIKIKHKFGH